MTEVGARGGGLGGGGLALALVKPLITTLPLLGQDMNVIVVGNERLVGKK